EIRDSSPPDRDEHRIHLTLLDGRIEREVAAAKQRPRNVAGQRGVLLLSISARNLDVRRHAESRITRPTLDLEIVEEVVVEDEGGERVLDPTRLPDVLRGGGVSVGAARLELERTPRSTSARPRFCPDFVLPFV